MEPILELATRITSHIWFLRGLIPEDASLALLHAQDWKEQARPADYAQLRDLIDLADLDVGKGLWQADDWLSPFTLRPPATPCTPIPQPSPPGESRECKSLRKDWRQVENDRDALWKLCEAALAVIAVRFEALRKHGTDGEGRLFAECPAFAVALKSRESLFEWVVEGLLVSVSLEGRVEIAKVFIPGQTFFVQKQISAAAKMVLKRSQREVCADLPPSLHSWEEDQRKAYKAAAGWESLADCAERFRLQLNPAVFRTFCAQLSIPVPFSTVIRDELEEIARSRLLRLHGQTDGKQGDKTIRLAAGVAEPACSPQRQAFQSNLFGLALSGGGIRSATFALGLLEGMADRNILPYIDLLSTVSGGGYIGSWLISWVKRQGGIKLVQEALRGNATPSSHNMKLCHSGQRPVARPYAQIPRNTDPRSDSVRPIRLLRHYARYLAPQNGLFAADSWTIVAAWLRNTLLNLLILASLFGAVLLLPRIAVYVLVRRFFLNIHSNALAWIMYGAALAFLTTANVVIGERNLSKFGPSLKLPANRDRVLRGDGDAVVAVTLLPVLFSGFLEIAFFWYALPGDIKLWTVCVAWGAAVLLGCAILGARSKSWAFTGVKWFKEKAVFVFSSLVSGLAGGAFAMGIYGLVKSYAVDTERGVWFAVSLGLPIALVANGITVLLFLGLMGNFLSDDQREWWTRMGALLAIAISIWLIVCGVCFFAPWGIAQLGVLAAAAGGTWVFITGWGAKVAFSAKSGHDGSAAPTDWKTSFALAIAPPVFALGLLCIASFGAFLLVTWVVTMLYKLPGTFYTPVSTDLIRATQDPSARWIVDNYWQLLYSGSYAPVLVASTLAGVALLLAWRVDINQFSMHNFYKNRLVRCYLGASRARKHRAANAFTGFDLEDDIRLVRFQHDDKPQPGDMVSDCKPGYAGPFPILNVALNVSQGQDVGLQERKAESFVFTPLWSGFDFSRRQASVGSTALGDYGYRQTREFGEPENWGVSLGTAMAISGAAFNSNMGFHTSPSLAFLLSVLGVRLGWWAGNPRFPTWEKPSPPLGIGPLVSELTANTDTDSAFVLLSDGGHFENMGLYELVRRRCRYMIVVDAEEDEKFKLEGIGGAIRKCRIDFGVAIDLNLEALQPLGDPGVSKLHYSLGSVNYPGEDACGHLIYIKSSVTGDEPVDVVEFRKRHAEFPHTSTVNQFFDESHFESYRALGHHVAAGIFLEDTDTHIPRNDCVQRLFRGIESGWRIRMARISKEKKGGEKNGDKKT